MRLRLAACLVLDQAVQAPDEAYGAFRPAGAEQLHIYFHVIQPGKDPLNDSRHFFQQAVRPHIYHRRFPMRKNRFCTFTLISALAIAALPASLSAAGAGGATTPATAASLPTSQNVTLTITPGTNGSYDPTGSKYTAYRVMSYTQQTGGAWTWQVVNGFTAPSTGAFDPDALGSYSAARLQSLADELALQVDDTTMTDRLEEKALNAGSCSWTTDKMGVYLVCETETAAGNFPAKPFLVSLPYTNGENENSWVYSLTVSPKGSPVRLQKVIHDAKGSYLNTVTYDGDKDTVAAGDTVQYRISTRIPDYTEVFFADNRNPTFELVDTMAKGLTLQVDSISLTAGGRTLTKDTDYIQGVADGDGGVKILTINMTCSFLSNESNQNQELVLAYSVLVNNDVSLADNGNENTVTLNYSCDPLTPNETEQVEDDAAVYSFGIQVEKFNGDADGAQKEMLSGAEFVLYKETTKGCTIAQALAGQPYREVGVTDGSGRLDFKGLDAGTYYLKEVKAPDGYSLLMNPIKVELIPDAAAAQNGTGAEVINSGAFTAKVNGTTVTSSGSAGTSRIMNASNREETVIVSAANHTGFSLPLTGGSGIILLLVISAAGLAGVTAMFMRSERKHAADGQGR